MFNEIKQKWKRIVSILWLDGWLEWNFTGLISGFDAYESDDIDIVFT